MFGRLAYTHIKLNQTIVHVSSIPNMKKKGPEKTSSAEIF